ncbi:Peptidyl-tRNA hydrolase [Rickettsiales endosymbiont of Paramecium tredecaurelia]|nr:Peptidyl-tRNA hydrolase [Candidatus Sarmatiella mevalonica]
MIVGLGNPGASYAHNRHNAGFIFIDHLASTRFATFEIKKKLKSELCDIVIHSSRATQAPCNIMLLKPTSYMNLSGQAVIANMSALKLKPEQILVVYDEVELELGKVRFKLGGGSAGHNGIRSIDQAIGREYFRLKIGIGGREREGLNELSDYVLGNFSHNQRQQLDLICSNLIERMDEIVNKTFPQDKCVQLYKD